MEEKKEKQENDIGAYASLFHIIDSILRKNIKSSIRRRISRRL